MKKRWLCLFVENEVGVLARISGLFSGKSYNLDSLTVGTTEDETVSRMTIGLCSDDTTFEQIKKQINRVVEVIKVIDYTELPIHSKELMYLKVLKCSEAEKTEVFRFAQVYGVDVLDFNKDSILLECVRSEKENDQLIKLLHARVVSPIEIARGEALRQKLCNRGRTIEVERCPYIQSREYKPPFASSSS